MLVYASRYTRCAAFTTSKPLMEISLSSAKPRPTRKSMMIMTMIMNDRGEGSLDRGLNKVAVDLLVAALNELRILPG